MSKPREFWIRKATNYSEAFVHDDPELGNSVLLKDYIHVIEYSAVASLQGENRELKVQIENAAINILNDDRDMKLRVATVELEALRKERDSLAETLGNKAKEWAHSFEERAKLQAERDEYRAALETIDGMLTKNWAGDFNIAQKVLAKYPKENHDKT